MKKIKTETAKSHDEDVENSKNIAMQKKVNYNFGKFDHKSDYKKRKNSSKATKEMMRTPKTAEDMEIASGDNRRCKDTDIYSSRLLFFSHLYSYLGNIVLPRLPKRESGQIEDLICRCDCKILQVKTPEVFFKNLECKCPVLWENCNREHGKVYCYCWNLKQEKNTQFFELFQNKTKYPNAESIARKIIMIVKPDQDYPKPLKRYQYTAALIKEFKADIIAYTIMCINLISLADAHDKCINLISLADAHKKIRNFYGYTCCKETTPSDNCKAKLKNFLYEFKLYIKSNSNTEEYEKAQKIIESIKQQLRRSKENFVNQLQIKRPRDEENNTQKYPYKLQKVEINGKIQAIKMQTYSEFSEEKDSIISSKSPFFNTQVDEFQELDRLIDSDTLSKKSEEEYNYEKTCKKPRNRHTYKKKAEELPGKIELSRGLLKQKPRLPATNLYFPNEPNEDIEFPSKWI